MPLVIYTLKSPYTHVINIFFPSTPYISTISPIALQKLSTHVYAVPNSPNTKYLEYYATVVYKCDYNTLTVIDKAKRTVIYYSINRNIDASIKEYVLQNKTPTETTSFNNKTVQNKNLPYLKVQEGEEVIFPEEGEGSDEI
ncbi:hypothetical protein CWI36_0174p0030 [Hamiltosporidium magnivora]|uniref:Uncharacterized protein n=1 Tax=Hamiltosporidium magnivora TaxID=148818 RepID=A0A4Q9LIZ8_9MICR|nr:hypothetical protein CWI36_0174p0030 [Hamiltosporidium magnivora]